MVAFADPGGSLPNGSKPLAPPEKDVAAAATHECRVVVTLTVPSVVKEPVNDPCLRVPPPTQTTSGDRAKDAEEAAHGDWRVRVPFIPSQVRRISSTVIVTLPLLTISVGEIVALDLALEPML